jgi:fatty-acyl-CoA synthase
VRARDPETGEILPGGEPGDIEVSGPYLFREYFGNPDATRAAMTEDGYLRTGDIGYTEPGNAFTYLQRANDTLRLSGFLVNPAEIEAAVMAAPGVSDAQVVAVGTDKGNRPVAFVIAEAGAEVDEGQVIASVGATLPKFKTPVRVIEVDAFPVTDGANGTKIQRAKLREMAEAAMARGAAAE